MGNNTFKAAMENRARAKKNSASSGSNKGKAPKYVIVHPHDRPESSDHNKWNERPAMQVVGSNTVKIRSVKTGDIHFIGKTAKCVPANL